jgi:type IV pilus assembly protein PilP
MMRRFFMLTIFSLMLMGCDDQPAAELKSWIEHSRRQVQPTIQKLPPAVVFMAYTYKPADRLDPFDAKKIYATSPADSPNAGALQPDSHRHREPLEAYTIDQLKMVGTLHRKGNSLALIEAEKIIYQVRLGNYLGQDLGKVVKIEEKSMDIDEMIQDATGNWNLRRIQLSLKEK